MNPSAVQIGLTATPRQLATAEARDDAQITADNLAYFGEPVYDCSITQAMEDSYLAACDIKLAYVDLDARGLSAAEIIQRNPTDADTGRLLTPRETAARYEANNFEKAVILPDRVKAMCRDLFEQMIANVLHRGPDGTPLGPRQKTIFFCATDRHADLVAAEMNNLFASWCTANGEDCPTLHDFRQRWIDPPSRREAIDALVSAGYSPQVMRLLEDMNDYDLYDVLAELGYGLAPRTCTDRAMVFRYKQEDWLNQLPKVTRAAVLAVADQFAKGGTDGLENRYIFQTPEVMKAGGVAALAQGGDPATVIRETKERTFAA